MNHHHGPSIFRPHARKGYWAGLLLGCFLIGPVFGAETGLLGRWILDSQHLEGQSLKAASGELNGQLSGPIRFHTEPHPESLRFGKPSTRVLLTDKIERAALPPKTMTVSAWVTIDQAQDWGGIVGVIQDNGNDEKGWLLGYVGNQFCFAVASDSHRKLTYMKSRTQFRKGHWYHVAGTYDGDTSRLFVNGKLEASNTVHSGNIFYPSQAFFEIGAYHDDNENYPMLGAIREVSLHGRSLDADIIRKQFLAQHDKFPVPPPDPIVIHLPYGPFVDWLSPTSIRISWESQDPMPTSLTFGPVGAKPQPYRMATPTRTHAVIITNIIPDLEHLYTVHAPFQGATPVRSPEYLFDSSFRYHPVPVAPSESPYPNDEWTKSYTQLAETVLEQTGIDRGYCLVLDAGEGRLVYELARRSHLQVIGLEADPAKAAKARALLDQTGLYGVRVSIHQGSFEQLPYGNYFANLIVSDGMLRNGKLPQLIDARELVRVLRPSGGVAWLGQSRTGLSSDSNVVTRQAGAWKAWLTAAGHPELTLKEDQEEGQWLIATRGTLPGAGDWTHQYGHADNTACSKDERVKGEVEVLWWGDPGPRPMPDRGGRNPAPLAANGRLFVQGDRILFGMDAYNGTILWTLTSPEIRRSNVIRDSSNTAASNDRLYVAHAGQCLGIDAQEGTRDLRFPVPEVRKDAKSDQWGFLAVIGDRLLGSSVAQGASYRADQGEWYDDYKPDQVNKVTSDNLFGYDRHQPTVVWIYDGGTLINSTITIGSNVVYFVESRNPKAKEKAGQRLDNSLLTDQFLIALNVQTGEKLWEQPFDFNKGEFMLYTAYSEGTLMVTGTDRGKNYHTLAFQAARGILPEGDQLARVTPPGTLLWKLSHPSSKTHHGGHIQHPLIIGTDYYVDNRILDLRSGKVLRTNLPDRRGCGTMSASMNSVFYRAHFHGMWDLQTDKRYEFLGIRSGCWLGLIPSQGLLLAPESSSGCSCTHSIQTSVAYIPIAERRQSEPSP